MMMRQGLLLLSQAVLALGVVAAVLAVLFSLVLEGPFVLLPPTPGARGSSGGGAVGRVLLRNVTGLAEDGIAFAIPARSDAVSLFVRPLEASGEAFVLLVDGEWGAVLVEQGTRLKILYEPHSEILVPLPRRLAPGEPFAHLAFVRQRSEHRLLVFFEGRQIFFVAAFDPPSVQGEEAVLYVGCPPAYADTVGSRLLVAHVQLRADLTEEARPPHFAMPHGGGGGKGLLGKVLAGREKEDEGEEKSELDGREEEEREEEEEEILVGKEGESKSLFLQSYWRLFGKHVDEQHALFLCAVAIGRQRGEQESDDEDALWCKFAYGHAFAHGLFGVQASPAVAAVWVEQAAQHAFHEWQSEGLKEVSYMSLQQREELLLDGMGPSAEEDEMIEVESYKNNHEWLGDLHYSGKRTAEVNLELAQRHYWAANTTRAKLQLARMHYHRQKLLDSNDTFMRLLREAHDENSADAANMLGCVAPTEKEATFLFESATRMDPPDLPVANTNAGIMHSLATQFPTNHTLAAKFLLRSAAAGDTPAHYWLGKAFLVGRGVPKSLTTAVMHLQHATRYHVLHKLGKKALSCALGGNDSCARRAYQLCGLLGLVECWADLVWKEGGEGGVPAPGSGATVARLLSLIYKAHHPAAAVERAEVANEMVLAERAASERFYELAVFAASRGSPEGLYNVGWYFESVGQLSTARRVYAALARSADNWAEAFVGVVSYARVWGKTVLRK